jgi:hypothetical protein
VSLRSPLQNAINNASKGNQVMIGSGQCACLTDFGPPQTSYLLSLVKHGSTAARRHEVNRQLMGINSLSILFKVVNMSPPRYKLHLRVRTLMFIAAHAAYT